MRRKHFVRAALAVAALLLLGAYLLDRAHVLDFLLLPDKLGWLLLLLLSAAAAGLLFEPLVKECFPKSNAPEVARDPSRLLKDYETLAGYYPIAFLTVAIGSLILAPLFFGGFDALVSVSSPGAFWLSALITGILNIFIFFFFTKAFRYGDLSLVSMTAGLTPVLTFPLSFAAYALFRESAPLAPPDVTMAGLLGILFIISALIASVFAQKRQGSPAAAPAGDWFARHPVFSGMLGAAIASVAINLDKVAVEAGNPFLFSAVVLGIVACGTLSFTAFRHSVSRLLLVFRLYGRSFLLVGVLYGGMVLAASLTLYGENVNYQGAIKRLSIVFATFYGAWVLHEGGTMRTKVVRILVAIVAVAGVILITVWG